MSKIKIEELAGGQLQEQFQKSFDKVLENLQNPNTSFKNSREINIKLKFTQNENRDDVHVSVLCTEKLAPQIPMQTAFNIGKDLRTGEMYCEEYGKQIRGQMSFKDLAEPETTENAEEVDTSTGEIIDFRKVSAKAAL